MLTKDSEKSKFGVGVVRDKATKGTRITVRLDSSTRYLLEHRHQATGESLSDIARTALKLAFRGESNECQQISNSHLPRTVASSYAFPVALEPLLPKYRTFGAEIWKERRRCLEALLAISELVREQTQSPQDQALAAEILRIGKLYGLLR